LSKLNENIHTYLEKLDLFSGCVLLSKDGEVLFSEGYGKASYELGVSNTPGSKFRIGSISKTFTAVSILQLVDKGQIRLNDAVDMYFPQQKNGDKISISNLLSHTSGIQNYTDNPLMSDWVKNHSTPDEIFHRFSDTQLAFNPGTQFSYSNSNYVLLGLLLEKITDKPYDLAIKESIFDPLGMGDSDIETPFKIVHNRTSGYELDPSKSLINAPFFNTTNAYGCGNIISTVQDLNLWDTALYSDKLITPHLKSKMFEPFLGQFEYGYGWFLQYTPFGKLALHSGGITGYSSMLLRFMDSGLSVIVLCNISQDINEVCKELATIAHNAF
jgi:CubicO group peptidase (beta-lactamase class C family)